MESRKLEAISSFFCTLFSFWLHLIIDHAFELAVTLKPAAFVLTPTVLVLGTVQCLLHHHHPPPPKTITRDTYAQRRVLLKIFHNNKISMTKFISRVE